MRKAYFMRKILLFPVIIVLAAGICKTKADRQKDTLVEIENKTTKVVIDLNGGSISDFSFKPDGLNPLSWRGTSPKHFKGHFICLDRWGQPSPAEEKNGMTQHGEAVRANWSLISGPLKTNDGVYAQMSCELPIAGLRLKRKVSLSANSPVMKVTEEITNTNKLGRVYNLVQHATLGPPFLDKEVIIDTKAVKGFVQGADIPLTDKDVMRWPDGVIKDRRVDLRSLKEDIKPSVVSFVFNEEDTYGWVTACNAEKELLIGYYWRLQDYPWLNMWRHIIAGRPEAYGLEFGTTGLHMPFKNLLETGRIFGRQLYEFLDTSQTVVKSYTGFLAKIPKDYKGVADIQFGENTLTLQEHGANNSRDILIREN